MFKKSIQILLVPVLVATGARADVLSELSPYLGSSSPDYDPSSIEPDVAVEEPGYAPFSPADSDIGVQQILGSYQGRAPVTVTLDASLNYTDNAPGTVNYLDGGSWFFAEHFTATWRPRIACGWFADIGLGQDLVRFDRDEAVDFENVEPWLGVVKSIPELDDLVFFTRYEYQRITTGNISESSYWAQRIRAGLQKDLILAPRHQLSGGVNAAFDLDASPDRLERNTYNLDLSYTYWFADHLSSTLSWSGSMWDFGHDSREDTSHIIGLELTWTPCRNARVYANVFYTNHDSNTDSGLDDFEAWQTGIGLGFNHTF